MPRREKTLTTQVRNAMLQLGHSPQQSYKFDDLGTRAIKCALCKREAYISKHTSPSGPAIDNTVGPCPFKDQQQITPEEPKASNTKQSIATLQNQYLKEILEALKEINAKIPTPASQP